MKFLKTVEQINLLKETIDKCQGDVIIHSTKSNEEFNLKSALSEYIGIGKLCGENGNYYEFFCMNKSDEQYLMEFFRKISTEEL